jgi:hypothetical protein
LIYIYIYIYTPIKNKNLGRTVALPSPQRAPPLREEGLKLPKIINIQGFKLYEKVDYVALFSKSQGVVVA